MAPVNRRILPEGLRCWRGSAAVETAVVLPFLALLAIGATDLGRFSYAHISVATAARNAAQYGSSSASAAQDTDGIVAAARAEMVSVYGVNGSDPTVTVTVIDEGGGDSSVKVTVNFRFDSLIKYPGLPQSLNLIRTVHMRVMPSQIGDDEGDVDD